MGNSPSNPEISGTECFTEIFGPPRGKFLETKYGRTHYILEGPTNADSLVILQHGLGSDSMRLQRIAESLIKTGKYQVLRYDLYDRGYSETDPKRFPIKTVGVHPLNFTMELHVEQMEDVLKALDLFEKPLIHCGHSMGALTGIAYAATHPERIKGLILMDAVCLPATKPLLARVADLPIIGDFLTQNFGASTLSKFVRASVVDPNHEEVAAFIAKLQKNILTNPRFFASIRSTNGYCRGMVGSAEPEYRKCCNSPQKYPIRLIWGQADKSTTYANCLRLKEIAEEEGCTVSEVSFEGMPHNVYFEDAKPQECAKAIVEFCQGVAKS